MFCRYCRIEMEMFDRICSNCGSEVEYTQRMTGSKIPYSSPTEIPRKEIPASLDTNKIKAGTRG